MTLIINGHDYSKYVHDKGYTLSYECREGQNSGMSLSGHYIWDIIGWKAVISCTLNALTAECLSQLLNDILVADYVTVTYFDTKANANRTSQFMQSIGDQNFAFKRHGINFFRDGIKLTLRER